MHATATADRRSACAYRGMVLLIVAMIGMGGSFGSVEVTMAAFASQHDARGQDRDSCWPRSRSAAGWPD